jgi:uncharacterized protein (UPF0276 family)
VAGAAAAIDVIVNLTVTTAADRVGIGWRSELAAGIFSNLDRIDLVEVIADDHFRASTRELRALRTLAQAVPMTLHGVAMGLASAVPVETRRMENTARVVDYLQPASWSEHLAFVRAGGVEIGHLAAPPRTQQNVDAAIANIRRATRIVGAAPLMENIATLIDPPASELSEDAWITHIVAGADAPLLLDLHNLYANALNFGADPAALLLRFPLHRVRAVHLSGGKWVPEPDAATRMRLLDDHVHDAPPAVFELLALLAQHAPQPLDVVLERDGNFPAIECLLAQLDAARVALKSGRAAAGALKQAA